jgi:hypothetical protein
VVLAKRKACRKKEPPIDPEVQEMFDQIWNTLNIAEEEVAYDVEAPLTTRKVLEKLEDFIRQDFEDSLDEVFSAIESDFCITFATGYFADYIVTGELPSRGYLEYYIGENMEVCYDYETLDEFVDCVNTYYDCYLRLVKFFDALPRLLEVKVVEGVVPELCSSEVSSEEIISNTVWYIGLKSLGAYGEKPIQLNYYALSDGRVLVTGYGLCKEDFTENEVPRLVERLKELSIKSDLTVYVYGEPPVDPKSISPWIPVRRLQYPPKL